MKDGKPLV